MYRDEVTLCDMFLTVIKNIEEKVDVDDDFVKRFQEPSELGSLFNPFATFIYFDEIVKHDQFSHACSPILISVLRSTVNNPFPNKLWFLHVCNKSLWKTLWEKEKLLVTSNFSFYYIVFSRLENFLPFISNLKMSSANPFSLGESKFCFGERVNISTRHQFQFARIRGKTRECLVNVLDGNL